MECDVLVVGLGPAGSAAAAAAARAGARVLAIDRKRAVGVPVQCAEFIPLPLGTYARAEGVLQQRIEAMASVLPSGILEHSTFRGLMIDRARFDQALADSARDAGAAIAMSTSLVALADGLATVRDRRGERELRFHALVAADGPHSRVAALLGLPPLETVDTRQYSVSLARPSNETVVWLSDAYPGGYAWLFPKGAVANLGLGIDPRIARDMKAPLDALHRRLARDGAVGGEILSRTGGAIPVGGLRSPVSRGKVLFAGDAAGLAHPITGAGIAPAVVSGELAGEAAARGRFSGYEEEVRDQFGASLARAVTRRRWLASRWRTAAAQGDDMHRRGWIAFQEYRGEDYALAA